MGLDTASPQIDSQGYKVQGSNKGTWNLWWCSYQYGDMDVYDEKNPHWCDCTKDGKWKDSSLSNPIYHSPGHVMGVGLIGHACGCLGSNGCKYTPYCMECVPL